MNDWLSQLHGFTLNILLLLVIIFIKSVVAHFSHNNPLKLLSWYCQRLASKVNKPQNTTQQQKIAGFIAVVITLIPLIIILWLFADFIAVPWLWQALLLYLALGDFQLNTTTKAISQALTARQTLLAKQQLTPLVLRDVEPLSSMGIAKATVEMLLLRYLQHYFIIACYFLAFGALAALSCRLIFEIHYCWNKKQANFQYFGLFIGKIAALIQWFPIRLFALLMLLTSIGRHFKSAVKLYKKYFFSLNNDIVIALLADILNIRLAGVAMYQGNKLRRLSFNDHCQQPQASDINRANTLIRQLLYFSLALTIIAAIPTLLVH